MAMIDGSKLRAARRAAGWTQKELSRMAGVRSDYISRCETGACSVSRAVGDKLAKALNVSVERLMGDRGVQIGRTSQEERDLLAAFRKMNRPSADYLLAFTLALAESSDVQRAANVASGYACVLKMRRGEPAGAVPEEEP